MLDRDLAELYHVTTGSMAASLPPSNPNADIIQFRKDFEELKLDIEDILLLRAGRIILLFVWRRGGKSVILHLLMPKMMLRTRKYL